MTTKRQMECSCCGGDAGRFVQWHNRDTGYGVCARCIAWIAVRGETAEEIERLYGRAGVHYEAPITITAAPTGGN